MAFGSIFSFFKKKSIFDKPSYKMDPTANTWEAKRMRDAMTDARILEIKDAHSWLPATHPEGEGSSYLVDDIHYDPATHKLTVKYRDGFVAIYDDITLAQAKDFITAPSKGRWAHANLWNRKYKRG